MLNTARKRCMIIYQRSEWPLSAYIETHGTHTGMICNLTLMGHFMTRLYTKGD